MSGGLALTVSQCSVPHLGRQGDRKHLNLPFHPSNRPLEPPVRVEGLTEGSTVSGVARRAQLAAFSKVAATVWILGPSTHALEG